MTKKILPIAALAAALVAPAAAAQTPDAREVSRSVSREVAEAVRAATQAVRDATRQVRTVRGAQDRGPEQTEKTTKSFKVGKTGALDLNSLSGDVTITGRAGEEIVIEAVKRVRAGSAEDAKAAFQAIQLSMTQRGERVEVRAEYARRDIRGGVDFTIAVPVDASVLVRTMAGDVKITGVKGEIRTDAVSGDITITGAGQSVRAKTMAGDVVVSDVASDRDVTFSSMSGDVTARNIKARVVEVSSTSGDLGLTDVVCERATGSTISGEVEFAGPLAKGGRYEFRSHSGDVRLVPTSTTGFEVEANTFSGTFQSDYPVTLRSVGPAKPTPPAPPTGGERIAPPPPPPPPPPPERPGRTTGERGDSRPPRVGVRGQSVQGTYGDGGAFLSLSSFSGDITIVKK
jgi:DUF4097 and DUF4098 domain-containing protein YvlB